MATTTYEQGGISTPSAKIKIKLILDIDTGAPDWSISENGGAFRAMTAGEITAYRKPVVDQQLVFSDIDFIRPVEDLYKILIDKGVISVGDIPASTLKKYKARQKLRDLGA